MLPQRRAQVWRHRPEFRRPRHFHDEPELNLVVRGTAVIAVGARQQTLVAGDALVFQPGQDHVLLHASEDLDLFVIGLRPELADQSVGFRAIAATQGARFDERELSHVAAELCAVDASSDPTATQHRAVELFSRALERRIQHHVVNRSALEQVRRDATLSGPSLARRARVSQGALSSRFHGELGVPLVEYRARSKLMRFVALVDAGASFTQAAFEAGFGSYAQCHRVFQRGLGCSPRRYFAGERRRIDETFFVDAISNSKK